MAAQSVLQALGADKQGLSHAEAQARLLRYGPNTLPEDPLPHIARVFFRQFVSPWIAGLLIASVIALIQSARAEASLILAVTLVHAMISAFKEWYAQRAANAIKDRLTARVQVQREGGTCEIDATELVPGDIVLLSAGDRVPADLRLLSAQGLEVDESMLSQASPHVAKHPEALFEADTPLGEQVNMCFSGTLILRGQGVGVAVATGPATELGGRISTIRGSQSAGPPLLDRIDRLGLRIAVLMGIILGGLAVIALSVGMPVDDFLLLAAALAVATLPKGWPVAAHLSLAVSARRLARRNGIVRQLAAIESLASCTVIASDKTGVLTLEELSAGCLAFPGEPPWEVIGEEAAPKGAILLPAGVSNAQRLIDRLCQAAVLANQGFLGLHKGVWIYHGEAVDVALLILAHKAGLSRSLLLKAFPEIARIPYEPERGFAASLNSFQGELRAFVKGSPEQLLAMCSAMATRSGDAPLVPGRIEAQTRALASCGYQVLAFASGAIRLGPEERFSEAHLKGLTLIGLVGLSDPLRDGAKAAVDRCKEAGIKATIVTGDHPATALALARELGIADHPEQVVTGDELRQAEDPEGQDPFAQSSVFARIKPGQKLEVVRALVRQGHFVAVTGARSDDARALKTAQVGVALGHRGTEVIRESADLLLTQDDFDSIVAAIEESRTACANVRKVIASAIALGIGVLVLFLAAWHTSLPWPLLPIQLVWLTLVTLAEVTLVFEPTEGVELKQPPRPPAGLLFDRFILMRIALFALLMGLVAFGAFEQSLAEGDTLEAARNSTLLLIVLLAALQVFNNRSETRSAFLHNPLRNPLLLFATLAVLLLHIGAMYTPILRQVLQVHPIAASEWLRLITYALLILVVMEAYKAGGRWIR